jgi:flagellar hook-length control protein FliK
VSPSAADEADDGDDGDDAHDADTVIADAGLTNSGTPAGAAAGKPAARRTSSTDTAASSNLISAQTVWLMAASAAANSGVAAAAPPATPAATTSAESIDTATALAAMTGNAGAADTAAVGSNWTGADNAAAAAAASFAASDEGAPGDTDASANGAPASPDRARASTDVSSDDLSALAQLVRGVSAAGAQTGGIERSIGTPVTDPGWSRDVAARVQMMASSQVQSATLRLSPEHLGPVEVHIDMQASQINVNFVAAHPDTRTALEQSIPTLRAMLAHGGLTLGQAQVQGEARSGSQSGGARARDNPQPLPGEEPMAMATVRGAGLIDEYA